MDLCKYLRNISGLFSHPFWRLLRKSFCTTQFRCDDGTQTYFVTTPIFYVNAAPHIGHVQSCLYADALKRVHHLKGKNVIFSTGTDEHGLKVQKAAKSADKEPCEFCKEVSSQFQNAFDKIDISYSHFIRTTEQRHIKAVHNFWECLRQKGHIYKGIYDGWYNVSEETFVPASQIVEVTDPSGSKMVFSESGQVLERMQEDNYIFSLSKFKDDILYWLSRDVVKPKIFAERLRHWINDGLEDLSVSRQSSRLTWGIPVPGDSTQTIYVWLDALVNYLTVGGYPDKELKWPADCHVIGKDILKFHGIYWPAFLIAAGLEPPKSILCHSHWTVNYEKMSKSKGNVVEPLPLIEKYGSDGLRYFLLKAAVPHSDGNYSEIKIQKMLNSDLADTLGNLLSRSTAPAVNKHQQFPSFDHDIFHKFCSVSGSQLIAEASLLPEAVQQQFLEGNFDKGIDKVMTFLRNANGFMQENKPWELVKLDDTRSQRTLDTVLHVVLETLRISGILLQPIIPSMTNRLLSKLGVTLEERLWTNMHCFPAYYDNSNVMKTRPLGAQKSILFSRMKS